MFYSNRVALSKRDHIVIDHDGDENYDYGAINSSFTGVAAASWVRALPRT
jgi:hypothetical protein